MATICHAQPRETSITHFISFDPVPRARPRRVLVAVDHALLVAETWSVGGGAGFDEVLDSPIIGAAGHPAGDVRMVTTRDGNVCSLGL